MQKSHWITPHDGIDELVASGRWVEVQIPLGTGNHYCTLACYYGYAGKTACERVMNERMLGHASSRATADPDTPYLLFTDGNVRSEKSKVITTMVKSGLLIDLHCDFNDLEVRAPTFNMHGITKIIETGDKGSSAIDYVLANHSGVDVAEDIV